MGSPTTEVAVRGSREDGFNTLRIFPKDAPGMIAEVVLTGEMKCTAEVQLEKTAQSEGPLSFSPRGFP
jgi:hypothetical protein